MSGHRELLSQVWSNSSLCFHVGTFPEGYYSKPEDLIYHRYICEDFRNVLNKSYKNVGLTHPNQDEGGYI